MDFDNSEERGVNSQRKSLDLNEKRVDIVGTQWGRRGMPALCQQIKVWRVQYELTLYTNQEPQLLKQIENIQFPCLLSLNIWGNRIESIEKISWIEMPMLEALMIWNNLITSFKSMRKCEWPSIQTICLDENLHSQIVGLEEFLPDSTRRLDLILAQQYSSIPNFFLAKLNCPKISSLTISPNLQKVLKRKYLFLKQ